MAGKGDKKGSKRAVIIKRYTIEASGHHGGAWKVAYADFVTAMMAFFLLMWLLNATTEDQRKGLADYFSPNNLMSHASSGVGEPFGGHTAYDEGALVSDRGSVQLTVGKRPAPENVEDGEDPVSTEFHRARVGEGIGKGPMTEDQDADDETEEKTVGEAGTRRPPGPGGPADTRTQGHTKLNRDAVADDPSDPARDTAEQARQEKVAFEQAAEQIKQAVRADPALADLAKQLTVDMTPDGLRIQILDEVKLPMFPSGSATPNERARLLMQKVVPVLMKLNHPISIAGHTDAQPFAGPDRTNWELSAERANATRRLLTDGGFPEERVESVSGHADREPLLPADPLAAANRRIAILVLREAPLPGTRSPDAKGSDVHDNTVHGSGVHGSDGRGSDGHGSDGHGSEGRGSGGHAPANDAVRPAPVAIGDGSMRRSPATAGNDARQPAPPSDAHRPAALPDQGFPADGGKPSVKTN